jgi:hypothetical protein
MEKIKLKTKSCIMVAIAIILTLDCVSAGMVSLTYDDGSVEDAAWIDGQRGHGVIFTAPTDNWSLSQVAILGKLIKPSPSEIFVVEVWDQNLSLLYKITDKASSYFGDNLTWSIIDLPDIKVSGNFLVSFFEFAGVWQGVDKSPSSGRSVLVSRNPNRLLNWSMQNSTQNQTNWMIQAMGYSPEPKLSIAVISDTASEKSPSRIKAVATDPDGNLKLATEYIVDNKTREIVWAQAKEMTGSSSEVEFSWPGTIFRISADDQDKGGIYAINNLGVMANLSSLLAYSAPCIIELNERVNFSAEAYFGEDGLLNALIDSYGRTHYISQDILDITVPGTDYQKFALNNITIIKDKSKIGFINTKVPARQDEQASEIIGPIVLSGTPSSHYDLKLLRSKAGMGEYVAIVKVEDRASNVLSNIAEKTIKVK